MLLGPLLESGCLIVITLSICQSVFPSTNSFPDDNLSMDWSIVFKPHTSITHHLKNHIFDFGVNRSKVKVAGQGSLHVHKFVSRWQLLFGLVGVFKIHILLLISGEDPYWFLGQKVNGHGHSSE